MGVYHFAGLGKSIGAVTAPFSYLSARKQMPGSETDPLFALSGEAQEDDKTRGSVEALVLFTTEEIVTDKIRCDAYLDNRAGSTDGRDCSNERFHYRLETILKEELRPLARREKSRHDQGYERTGTMKPLELYWCAYDRTEPVQTFERVAQVMRAAKSPGKVGKEIWVNLTGGSNIINGALQLAASLTGTPAQMYYLLSDDPRCIRHTVPLNKLRTERDHFWVNLPMVYLDFNLIQKQLLQLLDEMGTLDIHDLHNYVQAEVGEDKTLFVHSYLRPLIDQRLIVRNLSTNGRDAYQIGAGWQQTKRYLNALPAENQDLPKSLAELVQKADWFSHKIMQIE